MLTKSISKNTLVLSLFAMAASLLLASTYLGTKDTIAKSEREAAQKILQELYPEHTHDNDLLGDTVAVPAAYLATLGLKQPATINVAKKNGSVVGFIIPATAPDGYSGDIRLLVAINVDGTIAGVRTLAHNETPGLGDKVELRKSQWILAFNGKSLGNPVQNQWAVKKDHGHFDQFTGATITPRAVVSRVLKTLIFYKEHGPELLDSANPSATRISSTTGTPP